MAMAILLLTTALAVTYYTKTIDHHATIGTDGSIQAYSDVNCTQIVNIHDWGTFNVSTGDDAKSTDLYFKNEGNVAVNITWFATYFTSYDGGQVRYSSSYWAFYLTHVTTGEVNVKPENDTTPDKINLPAGQVAHFKFYLTALQDSPPQSLDFQTFFMSKST
jgi:hypothetical protein